MNDDGAHFEISIDGVPRTHRDVLEIAIEAAKLHKERQPTEEIIVRDLRDGWTAAIGWENGAALVLT
jgi:predicted nucleic acid-binding protein